MMVLAIYKMLIDNSNIVYYIIKNYIYNVDILLTLTHENESNDDSTFASLLHIELALLRESNHNVTMIYIILIRLSFLMVLYDILLFCLLYYNILVVFDELFLWKCTSVNYNKWFLLMIYSIQRVVRGCVL